LPANRVTRLSEFSTFVVSLTLGTFKKTYRSIPNFWATFSLVKVVRQILTKNGLDTFWAIFSQTHLVTLPAMRQKLAQK
jgi:hypothetical protein